MIYNTDPRIVHFSEFILFEMCQRIMATSCKVHPYIYLLLYRNAKCTIEWIPAIILVGIKYFIIDGEKQFERKIVNLSVFT